MSGSHSKQRPMAAQQQPAQQSQLTQQPNLTDEQKQQVIIIVDQKQAEMVAKNKRDFEEMQTRIRDMLQPQNRDKPVFIGSRNEYLAMDAAYKTLADNADIDERTMEGYPTTDTDWVARTAQLTAAINDFTDIFDKLPKNQVVEDITAVKVVRSLCPLEVQLLAGKILMAACDAHLGRYNIPSWPKSWKKDSYQNFDERLMDVCSGLAHSKAIVKSIMDAEFPYIMRFAVGPHAECKVKKDNKKVNNKRAEEKERMKKRLHEDDCNGNEGGASSQGDSGAQVPKRQKRCNAVSMRAQPEAATLFPHPGPSQVQGPHVGSTFSPIVVGGIHHHPNLPGTCQANQQTPSQAGATQAESSTSGGAEYSYHLDPYDESQVGPLEDVPDDNMLFDSDDFDYAV